MKKIISTLVSVLISTIILAQTVPQGINYQAVARDANGDVLMNQPLTIQFSVISNLGISWQEMHQTTTNDYGLFTTIIGQGATTNGGSSATFDLIDWGSSNHSLKVEIDYGNGYIDMGTTDFMSVPYSLHAKTAANGSTTDELQSLSISGDTLFISSGNYIILPSSVPTLLGCIDSTAFNYNSLANTDDGSCTYPGCTDSIACNYDATANVDDGSCFGLLGCTDATACNYDPNATCDDGSCFGLLGCTDATACNYDPNATCDDGSCFGLLGCTDATVCNYDSLATCDDGSCLTVPFYDNFDAGLDAIWINNGWVLDANGTPSNSTGPSDDLTGGGNYIYYETSSGYQTPITLTISCLDISALTNPALAFNYHMYGASMGTLDVLVNGTNVWSLSGNQGNQWSFAQVDLSAYVGTPDIEFVGTYGTSYTGDMALDNISIDEFINLVYGCTDSTAFNYDSSANTDDGSCVAVVNGCTDSTACNYAATANVDDGSCDYGSSGCTDSTAINYDSVATCDDGSCVAVVNGCTDSTAFNYNPLANIDDGSCIVVVNGCTDSTATNYNAAANTDDGSCTYPIAIGDTYQGGIVFYIFQQGDAGYVAGQVNGLIVAPSDQSSGAEWGCYGTTISGADGTAIGTGNQNTIDIEAGCTTSGTAADICANLTLGGYSDWFLPSKDELNEMYLNLHQQGLGGFAYNYYWSSTEIGLNNAWSQYFFYGHQGSSNKDNYFLNVRAVRAF